MEKASEEKSPEEGKEDVISESGSSGLPQDLTNLPGVGPATAEKLTQAGFSSLMSIAVASAGEIVEATGMTESGAKKVINTARQSLHMGFETGEDALKKRERVLKIPSGSSAVDKLLGGGFETGGITETYGPYGAGKSQMAHTLAVMAQAHIKDSTVVFIDTESTFRPERIIEIAKAHGFDSKKALKNLQVARAYNSDHQMLLAEKIEELIKNGLNVKLVIVDSLTAHFRAEFIGRGTLAERQQKLNRHMHTLAKLADVYNLCVYVTNQVMAKPDVFFGDPTEAIGGNIVAHNSQTRIYLRKGRKGTRVAKLVDSPYLEDGEASFILSNQGISDI